MIYWVGLCLVTATITLVISYMSKQAIRAAYWYHFNQCDRSYHGYPEIFWYHGDIRSCSFVVVASFFAGMSCSYRTALDALKYGVVEVMGLEHLSIMTKMDSGLPHLEIAL